VTFTEPTFRKLALDTWRYQ